MFTIIQIKALIVTKMVNRNKWGGSHTEHIIGGLPRHLIGSKESRDAIKELVRDGWLLPAKKTGEIHFSLNPEMADEIMRFYEEHNEV
jgi:hypothetical protein